MKNDNSDIEKLIKEVSEELKNKYSDFKGVYFYGSRVTGDAKEYSDYDLVFVFDRKIDWKFEYEVLDIIFEHQINYDIIIDVRVYSFNDIEKPITPFREIVQEEGIFYGV